MPAAKSTCSHCILDGAPLTFDRAAKLEHHRQQKHHKIAQEAYERGLQEGCNSTLVEGMTATHLQPVSVEMPPDNAVETETAYAHGFQDGKAAEKAMHNTVIKAMLDSHTRDIEAAFKRGKEHSIVTAAPQTLPLLPTQVGRLQSDLQQEPRNCNQLWRTQQRIFSLQLSNHPQTQASAQGLTTLTSLVTQTHTA